MDLALKMAAKQVTQPLDLKEFSDMGPFTLLSISGADRIRFQNEAKKSPEEAGVLLVALSLGDKDGNRIFTDDKLPECKRLPGRVLDYVALASRQFNFLDAEGYERAKKA